MIGTAKIYSFFFVMLGPLKVRVPFVQRTRGLDEVTIHKIAWWSFLILGMTLMVMVLDLVAMWFARRLLVGFSVVALQVHGAVLAVLQRTRSLGANHHRRVAAARSAPSGT